MENMINFDFKDIDFKGGRIRYDSYYLTLEEDMLAVDYPHGFFIDAGWYQDLFKIYVIRDYAWDVPENVYEAHNDKEFYEKLLEAIEFTCKEYPKYKSNMCL